MVDLTRRDFMRGVVGASLGLGYFMSRIDGFEKQSDIGWSEEVEDEAMLRNEVGDLMRERNAGIIFSNEKNFACFDEKNILNKNMSLKNLSLIKNHIVSIRDPDCYSYYGRYYELLGGLISESGEGLTGEEFNNLVEMYGVIRR